MAEMSPLRRRAGVFWWRRPRRGPHPPRTIGSVIVNSLGTRSTSALPAAGEWNRSARCLATRSTKPRPGVTPHDQPESVDR